MSTVILLVVAKAPVSGEAKTRLCPPATPEQAAQLAAASLLDTLDAVLAVPETVPVVALGGDLRDAALGHELAGKLAHATVIPQRGPTFAHRLCHAHADAGALRPGVPVLQIGMDTPQVHAGLLAHAAGKLRSAAGPPAVLGPATDGGWWSLGLRDPALARVLEDVPMSHQDTGERTRAALEKAGACPILLTELSDVDFMADARGVADSTPDSRFARTLAAMTFPHHQYVISDHAASPAWRGR